MHLLTIWLLLTFGNITPGTSCAVSNGGDGTGPLLQETEPVSFGGSAHDDGVAVVPAGDGGWFVVANTLSFGAGGLDIWLVKTDSTFTVEWDRTFGTATEDRAWNAVSDGEGGILIAGHTGTHDSATSDLIFVHVSADGETRWYRCYDIPGRQSRGHVRRVGDDGYVLSGWSNEPGGLADYLLIRTDAAGEMVWSRTYGGAGLNGANSVRVTDDGGFAIFGEGLWLAGDDYEVWQGILVRVDASGTMLWHSEFGGSGTEEGYALSVAHDGGFLVGGFSASDGLRGSYCAKCDPDGNQLWWRRFSSPVVVFQIEPVDSGYLIVGPGGVRKLDEDGETLWSRTYSTISRLNGLVSRPGGGFILIGVTEGASGDRDVALLVIDEEGNTG